MFDPYPQNVLKSRKTTLFGWFDSHLFIMVMLGCLADSVDHVGLAWLLGLGLCTLPAACLLNRSNFIHLGLPDGVHLSL